MSNDKIQELLSKLHDELQQTEINDDTRELIKTLDADIERLLDPEDANNDADPVVSTAQQLEAEFATNHPLAEKVIREIVETLSRMGV